MAAAWPHGIEGGDVVEGVSGGGVMEASMAAMAAAKNQWHKAAYQSRSIMTSWRGMA